MQQYRIRYRLTVLLNQQVIVQTSEPLTLTSCPPFTPSGHHTDPNPPFIPSANKKPTSNHTTFLSSFTLIKSDREYRVISGNNLCIIIYFDTGILSTNSNTLYLWLSSLKYCIKLWIQQMPLYQSLGLTCTKRVVRYEPTLSTHEERGLSLWHWRPSTK